MEKYTKKFEKLEKSSVKMTLVFSAAAVEESFKTELGKYAKQLTINGFRKGKAPVSLIESKYGESILSETFTDMLDKAVQEIFTPEDEKEAVAKEYQPLDSRALDLMNEKDIFPIKKGEDVVCQIKYDVYPQFELGTYKGLKVEYSAEDYDPKVEETELEGIRSRNAMIEEKKGDTAEAGDIVTLDLIEIAADGSEIEETRKNDYVCTLAETPAAPYELDKKIIGMKRDEVKTAEVEYAKESAYPEQNKTWKIVLKKIKVRTLPELDDDFAQDVNEKFASIDDLKKDIHDKAFDAYEKQVENVKIDALLKEIIKNTSIDVPELMVDNALEEKWYGFVQQFTGNGQRSYADSEKYLASMGITRESYTSMIGDKFSDENLSNIRAGLILDKLVEVEKTQVADDSELDKFIEENKIDTKMYGEAYESMVKGELRSQIGKDKAIQFLIKNNEFVKVEKKEETPSTDAAEETPAADAKPARKPAARKPAAKKTAAKKAEPKKDEAKAEN